MSLRPPKMMLILLLSSLIVGCSEGASEKSVVKGSVIGFKCVSTKAIHLAVVKLKDVSKEHELNFFVEERHHCSEVESIFVEGKHVYAEQENDSPYRVQIDGKELIAPIPNREIIYGSKGFQSVGK